MNENDNAQGHSSLKEKWAAKMAHIKGWAIDANPKNDPTYPIRHRFDEDRSGYTWNRPPQQSGHENILHSIERPDVTRVFGTSAPASGLSGVIRHCAFKFSEGRFAHWLLLLVADRVNMVEGFVDDLVHGRSTQCLSEMGMKAKWKHDRKAVVTGMAVGAAVVGMLALACLGRHGVTHRKSSTPARLLHKYKHLLYSRM